MVCDDGGVVGRPGEAFISGAGAMGVVAARATGVDGLIQVARVRGDLG